VVPKCIAGFFLKLSVLRLRHFLAVLQPVSVPAQADLFIINFQALVDKLHICAVWCPGSVGPFCERIAVHQLLWLEYGLYFG